MIGLKDTSSGINVNQSTSHTYNKVKVQEGRLHRANLGACISVNLLRGQHVVESQEAEWPKFVWQAQQVQLQENLYSQLQMDNTRNDIWIKCLKTCLNMVH